MRRVRRIDYEKISGFEDAPTLYPTTFILGLVLVEMLRKIRLDSRWHKAERR